MVYLVSFSLLGIPGLNHTGHDLGNGIMALGFPQQFVYGMAHIVHGTPTVQKGRAFTMCMQSMAIEDT